MRFRGIFTGIEQIVSSAILLVAILSFSAFIMGYYRQASSNYAAYESSSISSYEVQQISYYLGEGNYTISELGNSSGITMLPLHSYYGKDFCNFGTALRNGYSCGVVSYNGIEYVIEVDKVGQK